MSNPYESSPFCTSAKANDPWILWEKRNQLLQLNAREHNNHDDEAVNKERNVSVCSQTLPNQPVIQRPQYNAVLNRMNRALSKSVTYSTWNT